MKCKKGKRQVERERDVAGRSRVVAMIFRGRLVKALTLPTEERTCRVLRVSTKTMERILMSRELI